jgi:hypothetical protein
MSAAVTPVAPVKLDAAQATNFHRAWKAVEECAHMAASDSNPGDKASWQAGHIADLKTLVARLESLI